MYWLNGQFFESDKISLAINDPGLLYGATVFTTLRVWQESLDHPLSFWQDHCDRLHHSLQSFGWPAPPWHQLRQGAEMLANHYPVLRITVFPDGREWITGRSLPGNLQQWQRDGISAWLAPATLGRSMPGHKTGNYLACWLAGQQARACGCQEAILTDDQGNWLETSTGNLWGWADGCWWTPRLSPSESGHSHGDDGDILPGVGRSHLIRRLKWHNIEVQETEWHPAQVRHFETMLYTNSVRHAVPIARVLVTQRFVLQAAETIKRGHMTCEGGKYETFNSITYSPHHPQAYALRELFRGI